MDANQTLIFISVALTLIGLLLTLVFVYDRTRLRQTPGVQIYKQGVTQAARGDFKEAVQHYTKALRLNPNLVEAYISRGVIRADLGDKLGAIEDYTQVICLNPNCAEAYYNRGKTRSDLEDWQLARREVWAFMRVVQKRNICGKLCKNVVFLYRYPSLIRQNYEPHSLEYCHYRNRDCSRWTIPICFCPAFTSACCPK